MGSDHTFEILNDYINLSVGLQTIGSWCQEAWREGQDLASTLGVPEVGSKPWQGGALIRKRKKPGKKAPRGEH